MSVIDELYENRDETELSFELDEKFERLREFKNIPEIAGAGTFATYFTALPNIGFSMAELFKRCKLGRYISR